MLLFLDWIHQTKGHEELFLFISPLSKVFCYSNGKLTNTASSEVLKVNISHDFPAELEEIQSRP